MGGQQSAQAREVACAGVHRQAVRLVGKSGESLWPTTGSGDLLDIRVFTSEILSPQDGQLPLRSGYTCSALNLVRAGFQSTVRLYDSRITLPNCSAEYFVGFKA